MRISDFLITYSTPEHQLWSFFIYENNKSGFARFLGQSLTISSSCELRGSVVLY